MEIEDFKLRGETIRYRETPNMGSDFENDLPDTIVMHYTAGSTVESALSTLTNPQIKASAHLIIGRNGEIVQLAPFNRITWHAGKSRWQGRTGLNNFSIGIELDNAGLLHKTDSGYISWFNKRYTEDEVMKATHRNESEARYWHLYTEVQLKKTYEVCALLIDHFRITSILGHEEISPGRKVDPGPAFPLDKLRNDLLNNVRSDDGTEGESTTTCLVNAASLNIRKGAGTDQPTVTEPLKKGTELEVLETKGKWMRVKTQIEGWVHSDYVTPKP